MTNLVAEPTPQEIEDKQRQVGLAGQWLVRPPQLMALFSNCTTAYLYETLVGPGKPLGEMVVVSDRMVGIPAARVARAIILLERQPKAQRPRFKRTKHEIAKRRRRASRGDR
jgi:hypothetical protein